MRDEVGVLVRVSNYLPQGWLDLLTGAQYSFSHTLDSTLAYYGRSSHWISLGSTGFPSSKAFLGGKMKFVAIETGQLCQVVKHLPTSIFP
jgi:hypothetical protein